MKVLLVNKYLYPKGGSETYVMEVGRELQRKGCEVSYFGQYDPRNVVGNRIGISAPQKIRNPFALIYSKDVYRKFSALLEAEKPDLIHLNNINFQLTPAVIDASKKYRIPVVWTMHDPQLICPCHRLYIGHMHKICTQCIDGKVGNCVKNRCFKGSFLQSCIGYLEAVKYYRSDLYHYVSLLICPSRFMAEMLRHRFSENKLFVLRNYGRSGNGDRAQKEDYILYYGRLSEEKGLRTLLKAVPPDIPLKIAGRGPLEEIMHDLPSNAEYLGFRSGEELKALIQKAKFSVYPSEWYENCPFSVIESISFGTPVIGANIGGIPELINDGETGLLFRSGDAVDLREKIVRLYHDRGMLEAMTARTSQTRFADLSEYCDSLIALYRRVI